MEVNITEEELGRDKTTNYNNLDKGFSHCYRDSRAFQLDSTNTLDISNVLPEALILGPDGTFPSSWSMGWLERE